MPELEAVGSDAVSRTIYDHCAVFSFTITSVTKSPYSQTFSGHGSCTHSESKDPSKALKRQAVKTAN